MWRPGRKPGNHAAVAPPAVRVWSAGRLQGDAAWGFPSDLRLMTVCPGRRAGATPSILCWSHGARVALYPERSVRRVSWLEAHLRQ